MADFGVEAGWRRELTGDPGWSLTTGNDMFLGGVPVSRLLNALLPPNWVGTPTAKISSLLYSIHFHEVSQPWVHITVSQGAFKEHSAKASFLGALLWLV